MKTICSRCGSENDSSNMCCVFCGGELMKPKFYGSNDNQNNEYVQQVEQKKDMENEPHKPLEQPEPYTYVEEIDDTDDQYEIPVYTQSNEIVEENQPINQESILQESKYATKTDSFSSGSREIDNTAPVSKGNSKNPIIIGICVLLAVIIGFVVTRTPENKKPDIPTPPAPVEEIYISKAELDNHVREEYYSFISNYSSQYADELYGYLPECLESKRISEHKYDYYYVYLVGDGSTAWADFKVVKYTATASSDNTYTITKDVGVNYPIYLTNVNSSPMNVRDNPSLSGEIIGSVDINTRFRVYYLDCYEYVNGGNYIWYCADSNAYSQWVADGVRVDKDYYKFVNGSSTKQMVLYFLN